MADPNIDPRRWDFESLFTTPAGEDLPVACLILESEIEALHKIIGSTGAQPQMTERDRAAWALVAPFVKPAVKAAIAE